MGPEFYQKGLKAVKLTWLLKIKKELEMDKNSFFLKIDFVKSKYGNPFRVDYLTPDFMWLIGIIVSDGNINSGLDKRTGSFTAYHLGPY